MPIPVAMSSAKAEYNLACDGCMALALATKLVHDMYFLRTDLYGTQQQTIPAVILTDNASTQKMLINDKEKESVKKYKACFFIQLFAGQISKLLNYGHSLY